MYLLFLAGTPTLVFPAPSSLQPSNSAVQSTAPLLNFVCIFISPPQTLFNQWWFVNLTGLITYSNDTAVLQFFHQRLTDHGYHHNVLIECLRGVVSCHGDQAASSGNASLCLSTEIFWLLLLRFRNMKVPGSAESITVFNEHSFTEASDAGYPTLPRGDSVVLPFVSWCPGPISSPEGRLFEY
ncbi:UNVERIFIED_CONTAM: hypothetical protein FKN15_009566 [Acipenser sinensis]